MPAEFIETAIAAIKELRPYPGNARVGNVGLIVDSIRRNGQYRSLVVRLEGDGTRTILAGNHTALALTEMGVPQARVELIRCTDEEAVRINLVDNQSNDKAANDDEKLLAQLRDLDDLRGTGFIPDDVDALAERLRRHARTEAKAARILAEADVGALDVLVADDGTRSLVCRYHPDAYTWVAARLRECREEWSLATNGEALLRLLEEKFGASTLTARRTKSA